MAMAARDVKAFLAAIHDDCWVAIDDDGLTLVTNAAPVCLEIGGVPDDDASEASPRRGQ